MSWSNLSQFRGFACWLDLTNRVLISQLHVIQYHVILSFSIHSIGTYREVCCKYSFKRRKRPAVILPYPPINHPYTFNFCEMRSMPSLRSPFLRDAKSRRYSLSQGLWYNAVAAWTAKTYCMDTCGTYIQVGRSTQMIYPSETLVQSCCRPDSQNVLYVCMRNGYLSR